ncbi:MAG: pre-peptidase C-terminal domain-containing protein [Tetrasphaera sp.]
MRRQLTLTAAAATAAVLALAQGSAQASTDRGGDLTPAEAAALAHGVQVAPKGSSVPRGTANPYRALVPDESTIDFAYWRQAMKRDAQKRAAERAANTKDLPPAFVYDEKELDGGGSNDTPADAERITLFGIGATKKNRVRINGTLNTFTSSTRSLAPVPEDNGSIPLAGDTGLDGQDKITTTGVLGDGPHGSTGDANGDFDAYKLTAPAGQQIVVDTSATTTDTFVGLYDAAGTLLATDDDGGTGLASLLTYDVTTTGTYYVFVAGYRSGGPLPSDPFDSGSGPGVGREGNYGLAISVNKVDRDYFGVRLSKGDVLGGSGISGADTISVTKPDGTRMVGAEALDASSLYPPESPLPGAGTTAMAYVAEEAGWYAINIAGTNGDYSTQLEVYRPGGQRTAGPVQRVFLDFNGQRVNTGIWGGYGVRDLSPFSAFLGRWGLTQADLPDLVRMTTEEVNENLKQDAIAYGMNPNVQVQIVNSRNSADIYGQNRVARVIVGGTIDEAGIDTIGIAQYIDPGNYNMSDQALVLLDVLSDPSGSASLNTYMTDASDRKAFVAQAVGNVVAHEIGHLIGSYHTDNTNEVANLMDAGGTGFPRLFGVGPDGIGGTADDADTDFGFDTYRPAEGFTGLENTLNVDAWAWTKR